MSLNSSETQDQNLVIPKHVAIIMDGNGRWAQKRGLKRTEGHKEGLNVMGKVAQQFFKMGIEYLSFYAFSVDNWKRDEKEVKFLTGLIKSFYEKEYPKLKKEEVRILISGGLDHLDPDIISIMQTIQEDTKNHTRGTLHICFNYSGRLEIVEAAKKFAQDVLTNKKILPTLTVDSFYDYLFQREVPMVDFMIRTSGELRISDFLIYQNSYAEFYFTPVFWPDFDEKQAIIAIEEYTKRERRFGGIKP